MPNQPNVILVITDDQGYGDLGCLGNPLVQTPHLDNFHGESLRLTNYHVGPTCAPTRAGLLTGRYANSTGVWHTIGGRSLLRADEYSIADAFRANGYVTGLFGKWHLGDNFPFRPQDRGFDKVAVHGGGGVGNTPDYWGNCYFNDSYWTGEKHQRFEGYCTDVWFQQGSAFIERHQDQPFFCMISTNAPHSPHLVDPLFSNPYLESTPNVERANFYGMVTNIDSNFGALRELLEKLHLSDNTILIFTTDNGSAGGLTTDPDHFVVSGFNAGMRGQKGSPYEGGHRVPFFLHWPSAGICKGRDVPELTANIDFMPTIVDLCGLNLDSPLNWDGCTLKPLFIDKAIKWPNRVLVTDSQRLVYPVKWRRSAVMTQRWRLVNGQELFDMESDSGQTRNVAEAFPEVVGQLQKEYELWWERVTRDALTEIPITIGDPAVLNLVVNSHDWRNLDCECVWNQNQVRAGLRYNGYWELHVSASGRYSFELRRWPREENRGLSAGIPGKALTLSEMTFDSGYGGGEAIEIDLARIKVGTQSAETSVRHDAKGVAFEFELENGPLHLQTFLVPRSGAQLGAYYVYISKLNDHTGEGRD